MPRLAHPMQQAATGRTSSPAFPPLGLAHPLPHHRDQLSCFVQARGRTAFPDLMSPEANSPACCQVARVGRQRVGQWRASFPHPRHHMVDGVGGRECVWNQLSCSHDLEAGSPAPLPTGSALLCFLGEVCPALVSMDTEVHICHSGPSNSCPLLKCFT